MSQSIEDKLNELPYYIDKRITQKCECCGKAEVIRIIKFELKLEILPNCDGHRYLLYYKSNNYGMFFDSKYIGVSSGIGYNTLDEAIDELKKYIK